MNPLPTAIEHSLIEAGCSATEILLIQHMLSGQPTTLRILAQKTGRSTGVLDQAMKKLMKKGIVVRENVNESPKFVLKSLQNVVQWLHDETLHRREMLLRKYQTFEAFVATMESEQSRPEMRYFEGEDGLEQAYFSLLDHGKVWRQYVTIRGKEQDDPLWQMRVRLFRARKERGVFCRVLTHDTADGKAFQARDAYEYRETLLLPPDSCLIPCEKIIAGDIVACFQHDRNRACFVRFPEQAQFEINSFDLLWQSAKESQATCMLQSEEHIQRKTRLLSDLRAFCLRPTNVIFTIISVFIAIGITGTLYVNHTRETMNQFREKIVTTAAVGALQFRGEDLDTLRTVADVSSPIYQNTVLRLNQIRHQDPTVVYTYIIKPTDDVNTYAFVADADAIDPNSHPDTNGDGMITDADTLGFPGVPYDIRGKDAIEHGKIVSEPTANESMYTDQWGSFYTAYAPIRRADGSIAALLAADVWATTVQNTAVATFQWSTLCLLIFFGLMVGLVTANNFDRILRFSSKTPS